MRFVALEKLINMSEGYCAHRRLGFHDVLLVEREGEHYVFESRCPHREHPLDTALIASGEVTCSLHGYRFRLADGEVTHGSEQPCRALKVWPVHYEGTELGVMVNDSDL